MRPLNHISKEGRKFIHENGFKPSYFNDKGKTMSFYSGNLRLSDHWGAGIKIFNAILPIESSKSNYLYLCKEIEMPNNRREFVYLGVKFERHLFDLNENIDILTIPLNQRCFYK